MGNTIQIAVEEYKKLVKAENAIEILTREAKNSQYSIDRERIATICGFSLNSKENVEEKDNE